MFTTLLSGVLGAFVVLAFVGGGASTVLGAFVWGLVGGPAGAPATAVLVFPSGAPILIIIVVVVPPVVTGVMVSILPGAFAARFSFGGSGASLSVFGALASFTAASFPGGFASRCLGLGSTLSEIIRLNPVILKGLLG